MTGPNIALVKDDPNAARGEKMRAGCVSWSVISRSKCRTSRKACAAGRMRVAATLVEPEALVDFLAWEKVPARQSSGRSWETEHPLAHAVGPVDRAGRVTLEHAQIAAAGPDGDCGSPSKELIA